MAASLLALIQGIPALRDIFLKVVDLYFQQQEAADINSYDEKRVIRDALLAKLKPGISIDEAKEVRRALFNLRAK